MREKRETEKALKIPAREDFSDIIPLKLYLRDIFSLCLSNELEICYPLQNALSKIRVKTSNVLKALPFSIFSWHKSEM